jgi:hypothetical protein
MNSPTKELLDDLINDRDQAFDDQLLTDTLAAVRRQKTRRRAGNVAMAFSTLLVLAICWMAFSPTVPPSVVNVFLPKAPEFLVSTEALSANERVVTAPGAFTIVSSEEDPSLVVNTVPSPDLYQLISDVELRMLLAEHNPVLLRQPNRRPQLLLDGKLFDGRLNVN